MMSCLCESLASHEWHSCCCWWYVLIHCYCLAPVSASASVVPAPALLLRGETLGTKTGRSTVFAWPFTRSVVLSCSVLSLEQRAQFVVKFKWSDYMRVPRQFPLQNKSGLNKPIEILHSNWVVGVSTTIPHGACEFVKRRIRPALVIKNN